MQTPSLQQQPGTAPNARRRTPGAGLAHRLPFPRWAKVVRDLWSHKSRSLLVILSIAVGVFAIGTIAGTAQVLDRQFAGSYAAVNPAQATLSTSPFDDDLIRVVAGMPQVADATGRFSVPVRVDLPDQASCAGGDACQAWKDLSLLAIPDYDNLSINAFTPEAGAYPPPEGAVLMERNSLPLLDAQIGDTLSVELPDGRVRELVVAGTVHDINLPPARFVNATYGYVDFRTLNDWGYDRQFSQLSITVAQDEMDKAHIEAVAQEVKDKVERSGRQVGSIRVPEPGQPPVQDILDPLLLILGILGVLALLLSGFLVVNTMAAILAQQVRQIGVMKAVGARSGQIMALYFGKALLFGLLSLAIGIPLGAVGAYRLSLFAAQFLNFDVTQRAVYPQVLALQVAVALVMPVAAAAVPTFTGSRITVREAISSYGLGKGRFGQGPFDRLLVSVQRWLPWIGRPLLISLRNTFRRKARLILTMTTLTLGGAIFVAVFSVQLSLFKTLDQAAQYYNYDVYVQFDRAYRIDRIAQDVGQVAGVTAVETWASASAVRERPDGNEGDRIRMLAPMADTTMIRPNLLAGRWLLPEDESALVINSSTLDEEPDLAVGGTVTLKIDGKESDWTVVGVVQSMLLPPTAYANYPYLSRLVGTTGRANFARITIDPDTPADQERTAAVLNDQLDARGYQVSYAATTSQDLESTEFQFNILVTFLLIMALLMAVVGGMGLMGTMSINVMERTREIGVMRAIGASTGAVLQIIMVEGMLIGLISWAQGVIAALPIGKFMADQIGYAFVDDALSYGYSVKGALVWLGIAVLISAVASYLPARTASRLTVREVLSYE